MMDEQLLEILVCPETKEPVSLADKALVARVNEAIGRGTLKSKGGQPVTEPVDGGLVRQDGKRFYPIRDDIPVMLTEEAILLPLADA
ncbi:MAG: hypothetical protein OEV94_09060 [Deltaproteobacteria bacterium]|nr:hypothetical protein [Deltaproteobacteria bacterium]